MTTTSFHVALTGHRPNKLAGYDLGHQFYVRLQARLEALLVEGLGKHEHLSLHSGMALGADTVWSMAALNVREQHRDRISFVAEVPVMTQSQRWPSRVDRDRWASHLAVADEVHVYAQAYSPQCLWARNRAMIDAAQLLLAVWDGQPGGGTAGAVDYAQKHGVRVYRIDPAQLWNETRKEWQRHARQEVHR